MIPLYHLQPKGGRSATHFALNRIHEPLIDNGAAGINRKRVALLDDTTS